MSGCYPLNLMVPATRPASVEIRGVSPTFVSTAHSLRRITRTRGAHRFYQVLRYGVAYRNEVAPVRAFCDRQQGQAGKFAVVLAGMERPQGAVDYARYVSFAGASGDYVSTPDSAALSAPTTPEMIFKLAPADWTPGSINTIAAKWNGTAGQLSFILRILTGGEIQLTVSPDGTASASAQSTVATGLTDAVANWLKVALTPGVDVKFYTSSDGVTWTQLGTTVSAATLTAIFDGASPLEIGSNSLGTGQRFTGKIYYAEFRNVIGGEAVARMDPAQHLTGTTWESDLGETYTLAGTTYTADCGALSSASTAAGAVAVPIDGLAARILAFKREDIVQFEGHKKIYEVVKDAWTDGSGAVTLTINTPLMTAVANNERMRCGSLHMQAALIPDEVVKAIKGGLISSGFEAHMVEDPND